MILNEQHEVRVARRPLESFLRRVKRELGLQQSEVTVCLLSDKVMARLNQSFRKKKGPTDVLSFSTDSERRPGRIVRRSRAAFCICSATTTKPTGVRWTESNRSCAGVSD